MTPSQYRALKPAKKSKYYSEKGEVDNLRFDSQKEKARYGELKMMQRAGMISNLELQVVYILMVNGMSVGRYIADFRYKKADRMIVEDCKGFKTPVYRLKKKLMEAIYGVIILET